MKKLILSIGAVLCFGLVSAQTEMTKKSTSEPTTEKKVKAKKSSTDLNTTTPATRGTTVKGVPASTAPNTTSTSTNNGNNRAAGNMQPSTTPGATSTPPQNASGTPETTPPTTR